MAIRYTEKGGGLHQALEQSGVGIAEQNGVWTSVDEAAAQAIIDAYTLEEAREWLKAQVDELAAEKREQAVGRVAASEMAAWYRKQVEADRVDAEPSDAGDAMRKGVYLIWREAQARGVSTAQVASRVQANANRLSMLEASIAGAAGKHKDEIDAAADFGSLAAYDYRSGWPV